MRAMESPDPAPISEAALSEDDVEACVRVLRAIQTDRAHLTRLTREQRRELLTLAGLVAKPERHELVRMAKAFRRAEREAARAHDRMLVEQAALRVQRRSPVYAPLRLEPPAPEQPDARVELRNELACYVCKQPFAKVHRYYDSLCESCGDFNYAKREQTADLGGHYALVTGARVKIGYQAALKLLRAGAHVIVTTRFPVDAASRYAKEPDFLRVPRAAADLRARPAPHTERGSVHAVSRRAAAAARLHSQQRVSDGAASRGILSPSARGRGRSLRVASGRVARRARRSRRALPGIGRAARARNTRALVAGATGKGEGLVRSAELSQRHYLDEDYRAGEALFPTNRYDEDLQQVDLREINSWRLRLHEVETPELLEVHLVNAIAPYVLNARLKPLLVATAGRHKHVVNVSAMEGQFYRTTKTEKHPHTNMAKAALNMMTRTSAPDFVRDGIHMNAVDTGWVTDEDPAVHAARKAELGFSPPLDIIDGAARIVDPIFVGRLTGEHVWGQFLKDYKPAPW